jgi:hypothetical protein
MKIVEDCTKHGHAGLSDRKLYLVSPLHDRTALAAGCWRPQRRQGRLCAALAPAQLSTWHFDVARAK